MMFHFLTRARILLTFISFMLLSGCQPAQDSEDIVALQTAIQQQTCSELLPLSSEAEVLHQDNPRYFLFKGICERRSGDYKYAILDLKQAEKKKSKATVVIWLNLAASYAALGQDDEVYGYLTKLSNQGIHAQTFLANPEFDQMRSQSTFQDIYYGMKPSYNLWTALFLFVALQAIFVAVLLIYQRGNPSNAHILLAVLMVCFAITIFSFTLYWTGHHLAFPYFNSYYNLLPYLAGPLFYLYIRNTVHAKNLTVSNTLHFIPAVVICLLLSPWLASNYIQIETHKIPLWINRLAFNPYTQLISLAIYSLMAYKMISQPNIKHENIRTWLKFLTWGFIGYFLCMLTYYVLVNFDFFNPIWDYSISFALSFFIFIVGFMGYLQPRVFAGEQIKEIIIPTKYQNSGLTHSAEDILKDKLERLMTEKKVYTQGDLRLDDLADLLNSNRHNVSMVINKHFGGNFFDFLNRHRVDYVKNLMTNPTYNDYTMIQLAYEAGFNNKVSFNKAFKKFTNLTPTAYKKQIISESIAING